MRIGSVCLSDFRNLRSFEFMPGPGVTVLTGRNAAGKTNALEAIALVTSGASFRRSEWRDLVRQGRDVAAVTMAAEGETGRVDVALQVSIDNTRTWTINGKTRRSGAGLARLVPSVVFTPDDLQLVKGSADVRRAALDSLGAALSEAYARSVKEYARSVRQRNALLREEGGSVSELGVWDQRVAELGGRLTASRGRLLARLAPMAAAAMKEVSGEGFSVSYEDKAGLGDDVVNGAEAGPIAESIIRALEARRAEELARGVTLVGPHRDDIILRIGQSGSRTMASQGQQRTAVLAWKLAEVALVREVTGRRPVVLLDDVMSELDEARREALTVLAGSGNQTIITTTNLGYFSDPLLAGAAVVEVGER